MALMAWIVLHAIAHFLQDLWFLTGRGSTWIQAETCARSARSATMRSRL